MTSLRSRVLVALVAIVGVIPDAWARPRIVRAPSEPVAVADGYEVAHGTTLNVPAPGVLRNDLAIRSSAHAVLVTPPSHGTLTLSPNGAFVYTPTDPAAASDDFSYRITATPSDSPNSANVHIAIIGAVPLPLAVGDGYSVSRGGSLHLVAPGVLANDNDSNGNVLWASLVTPPSHGTLTLDAAGSFTYVHDGSSAAADSFTYQATNGSRTSAPATVTISVVAVNAPPVAAADTFTVARGGVLHAGGSGVLANDHDPEGSPLTAQLTSNPAHGFVTIAADGSFTYVHDGSASTSDAFTYSASDGQSSSVPATVSLTVHNTPPVAVGDGFIVGSGGVLQVVAEGLLNNDSDADGDVLTAAIVTLPAHGTATVGADGSFHYQNNGDSATTDSFTYRANDGLADSNAATVAITIHPVAPAAPVANDDNYSVVRGAALNVAAPGLLANDTDPQSNPLSAALLTPPAHGVVAVSSDGSFHYQHNGDAALADVFTYRASNGVAATTATVHLSVQTTNLPPLANGDVYSAVRGGVLSIAAPGLLVNDSDPEGAQLTAHLVGAPLHGSVLIGSDGAFDYVNDGSIAATDSFSYAANDGAADSAATIVTINIISALGAPVANADHYTAIRGGTLTIAAPGVTANDNDPQNNALTAILVTAPAHGSLLLAADGSFVYHNDGSPAASDAFTYRVSNGTLQSAVVTVTIDITAAAVPPSASNDSYSVARGGHLAIAAPGVLANDTAAPGATLSASAVSAPAHGVLALSGNGSFTYDHDGSAGAVDTFTYRANDGSSTSAPATVTITITTSNQPPIAHDDSYSVAQGGALITAAPGVLSNDSDPEGATLSAVQLSAPAHGSVTLDANGGFVYHNDGTAAPADQFTYKNNDGQSDSAPATVHIGVTPVNHAPVASADSFVTDKNTVLTIAAPGVLANDNDADGNVLTAVIVSAPAHGTATLASDGGFTYHPTAGFTGTDSFTYKANDGTADSNVVSVTIAVQTHNTAPVATNDSYVVNEDGVLGVAAPGVLINDHDAEGDAMTAALSSPPAHGTVALGANGSFVYTPAPDYFGPDSFSYVASDGQLASAVATAAITVTPVNDVPTFTAGGNVTVLEDSGPSSSAWASAVSAGPANESAQTVNFIVSNNNNALFAVQPAVAPNGTLTFTPAANANGTATVTVRLHDDGGVSNGGVDTSAPVSFSINVTAVNDPPSFTAGPDQAVVDGAGAQSVVAWATAISAGPPDEAAQTLTFAVTNDNNGIFTVQPAIAPNGTLTFTPLAGGGGIATVSVVLHDNGGVANGGSDISVTRTFHISINRSPAITSANQVVFEPGLAGTTFTVTTTGFPTGAAMIISETGALPGGLTFTDNHNGTASIAGTASGSGAFPITITANNGVAPAASQSFTIRVQKAPAITSGTSANFTVGVAGTFNITTTGAPTAAISRTGTLPTGLSFLDNGNGTATISGTPAAATGGSYPLVITAANAVIPNAVQNLTLTVQQPPAITSGNSATFTVGAAGTFTVTTTGFPTGASMLISESGALPSGVTLHDNLNGTATLAGIPASGTGGSYLISITANNGVTPAATQPFTLTVQQPPSITSGGTATFQVGQAATFTVTTSGFPAVTTLTETGALPTGVSFTDNHDGTATLAGTPAAATGGSYPFLITATSGVAPAGTQNYTLVVNQAPQITSGNSTTFTPGVSGTFAVTTTGFPTGPTLVLTKTGTLPAGVTFVDNGNGTATISGTPAAHTQDTSPYVITNNAANGVSPAAAQTFTLSVTCPTITVTGTIGAQIYNTAMSTATFSRTGGNGAITWSASGLPSGVTIVATGVGAGNVTGTPLATGHFSATITATDAFGCSGSTLVAFDVAPKLAAKAYPTVGNTQLAVAVTAPATPSVFSPVDLSAGNQSDVAITYAVFAAPIHGVLTAFNSDGTFLYTPDAGNRTTDTFTWTGTSNGVTAQQTATISFNGLVWYVNNATASLVNDGRSNTPDKTMTALAGLTAANDFIFVYQGSGSTTGAFTMLSGQSLIGEGASTPHVVEGILTLPTVAGNFPTLSGTLTLASSATVDGLDLSTGGLPALAAPAGATAMNGNFHSVTSSVQAVSVNGTLGSPTSGTLTFGTLNAGSSSCATCVSVNFFTGTFTANGGTIQNSTIRGAEFIHVTPTSTNSIVLSGLTFTNNATSATAPTAASGTCGDVTAGGDNTTCHAAIHFDHVTGVKMTSVTVTGTTKSSLGMGINGFTVNGLDLTNVTVNKAGDGANEHGMNLQELTGSVNLDRCTIQNNQARGVSVIDTTGTLTMTVSGGTYGDNTTPNGLQGLFVETLNGNGTVTVQRDLSNLPTVFQNINSNAVQVDNDGDGAVTLAVTGATFSHCNAMLSGSNGGNTADIGTYAFTVTGNDATNLFAKASAITFFNQSTGSQTGTIASNLIGSIATAGSGCSVAGCDGIRLTTQGSSGLLKVTVNNNQIFHVNEAGIFGIANVGSGRLSLALTNNTIGDSDNLGGSATQAIHLESGALVGDTTQVCATITGNSLSGANWLAGIRLRNVTVTSQINLPGLGVSTASAFLTPLNTFTSIATSVTTSGAITDTGACP